MAKDMREFPGLDNYKATSVLSNKVLMAAAQMGLNVDNLKPSAILSKVLKAGKL